MGAAMSEMETFIQSVLGPDIEKFDYEAGGYEWVGWKKYVDHARSFNHDAAMKIVEASWRACQEKDVRLLAAPTVFKAKAGVYADGSAPLSEQIFAPPNLPVLDVIELCDVGSHN